MLYIWIRVLAMPKRILKATIKRLSTCTSDCWKEKICLVVIWNNCSQFKDIDSNLANTSIKLFYENLKK